ncbi:hypothetical protein MishRS11D_28970 [Methylomagnum ishizawai]|nr:hypothetical protein MishRS11D_28970 [Methylomagnum ishizawai]
MFADYQKVCSPVERYSSIAIGKFGADGQSYSLPALRPPTFWQAVDMAENVLDLLGCLGSGLGQVPMDALGPLLDRHGMGQVVEGVLPDEADEVFGRVELGE